jgi:hypothetical protein
VLIDEEDELMDDTFELDETPGFDSTLEVDGNGIEGVIIGIEGLGYSPGMVTRYLSLDDDVEMAPTGVEQDSVTIAIWSKFTNFVDVTGCSGCISQPI